MKLARRTFLRLAAGAAALPAVSRIALAQNYPTQPITIIVPFPAGAPLDILARVIGERIRASLGQSVIVENVAGAGGIPGMRQVAEAAKDGYTLSFALTAQFAINPSLFANLPYDPLRDFDPVSVLASAPYVLVVHPSLPARSVKELIALAKMQPSALSYASAGNGSGPHLSGALLNKMAGIEILHIPYKGGGPGLIDVLAGRVPMTYVIYPSMAGHLKAGKLRALGVTTAKRWQGAPDIPAIGESLPGFEVNSWYGLLAPTGTPREIITRLNTEVTNALREPDARARLYSIGAEPMSNTPEEFGAFIHSEMAKWAKVVKVAGIRVE